MDDFIPFVAIASIFIALPWIILHYVSKWKTQGGLTEADENLLDELHDLARRLDDRMCTIERIVQAENPNWRQIACDPADIGLESSDSRRMRDERAARLLESGGKDIPMPRSRSNQPEGRSR